MKFDHPEYAKTSIEIPDEWTVRQVLAYDSVIDAGSTESMYEMLWEAAKAVITEDDISSEIELGLDLDLSQRVSKDQLALIKWISLAGWSARQAQDTEEKN